MRCVIYTRFSTDEQAASEYSSLKRQEEICRNDVDIHAEKGWKVTDIYQDAGYSGKDFQRPGIQELMDDVRAGKLDVIVTYKIDRISRSLKDFYELWEVLKANNVTFVSATQHLGLTRSRYSARAPRPRTISGGDMHNSRISLKAFGTR